MTPNAWFFDKLNRMKKPLAQTDQEKRKNT